MRPSRPLTASLLASAVVGSLLLPGAGSSTAAPPVLPAAAAAAAPRAGADELPQGGRSRDRYAADITWTEHGIPHITADDFGDLGYGSGYAAAEMSACTLLDTLLTGRGERSRWLGPDAVYDDQVTLRATNLQVDTVVTDLRNREVVEQLLADPVRGPGREARQMVQGYVAGINRWVRENEITDPACRNARYIDDDATPLDVWYGVYLANLLASTGVFMGSIADAAPPSPTDPGLPELPVRASDVDRDALLAGLGRDPERPFGSNATAVGAEATSTRSGMILGNPHFPWRGRYHFTQQHLTIPGKYDVAGASLVGSPVVNIGFNDRVAWSHTVSTAYRFTPYEYLTPVALSPTTYLTDAGPAELERREVEVAVRREDGSLETVTEDVYRTPEGYVIDAPDLLMPWGVGSFWAIRDANGEHLRTIDTFLEMGKARDVEDLLRRQDRAGGMPWVNTTAADRDGNVLYADHSVVPHVTDEMAATCMTVVGRVLDQVAGLPGLDGTRAGSSCAWGADEDAARPGIFGPANLPDVVNRSWVHNANDSYWTPSYDDRLEGFDGIIGCEQCTRTMRTRMVAAYVADRLAAGKKETPRSLAGHQHENRVYAAEVMREDGALDAVCEATGETEACAALAAWDGRSDRTSRGVHLFEAFVGNLPAPLPVVGVDPVWTTPFDPADPFNTPRGLNVDNPQVVQAMQAAIDQVRDAGVAFDARWGDLQVAGDRGAPPIGLGGGAANDAGNANALASYRPEENDDRYKPITYGSSHIQAIAFRRNGPPIARTILTYSQSEDPTSRFSADQTRLFGAEKWVRFAWTDSQIRRDRIAVTRLR